MVRRPVVRPIMFVAGLGVAAFSLAVLSAAAAGAQVAADPVIELDGITVVTGPAATVVTFESPGIDLEVVAGVSSTPSGIELFGATTGEMAGFEFGAVIVRDCADGLAITALSATVAGGPSSSTTQVAEGTWCTPPTPPLPPEPPEPGPGPVPRPDVGDDVTLPPPLPDPPLRPPEIVPATEPAPPPSDLAPAPAPVVEAPPGPPGPPEPFVPAPPPAPIAGPAPTPAVGADPPGAAFMVVPVSLGLVPLATPPADVVAQPADAPAAVAAPPADAPAAVAAPPPPGPGSPAVGPPSAPPQLGGRITLFALTRDGVPTGRPGVGVTLSGTGYPPRQARGTRTLAAPDVLAQQDAVCDTVYFFFDGVRIGLTRPDAGGSIRRTGLSVPGGADPGVHAVTASCRSAGTPVLASTEFAVVDADPHRSAFATSLHRPDHVELSLSSLLLSALGAVAMLLLIAFPAELFNTTLEAHYDEVRGWFGLRPRPPAAGTGASNVAVFVLFLALSGPLWFAMQSSSALDLATGLAALGLSLATAVVVLASDLPTFVHLRRRYGEGADVVALPGTLVVALACVLLSRAVRFEPGYFYGLVGGLAFSRHLRRETTGRLAATSVLIMIALSVVAWLALVPVARVAGRPDAGAWPILAENLLGGVFWAALDSLVIALLPLRLLAGSKVVGWSRAVWAVLYAMTLFAFVHILLRPGTGYVSDTSRSPTVVVVGLFVAFAVFSFGFWGYFRFRSPRPSGRDAVPA